MLDTEVGRRQEVDSIEAHAPRSIRAMPIICLLRGS